MPAGARPCSPPLWSLLYRYYFFGWLFRDANAGTPFERGLAIHHNRRQARWLPTYMLRWAWWALFFYGLGAATELFLDGEVAARFMYAASAGSIAFIITMATAWVHLTQRSEP